MNDSQQLKRGQVVQARDALEVYYEQFRGIALEPVHTMGAQAERRPDTPKPADRIPDPLQAYEKWARPSVNQLLLIKGDFDLIKFQISCQEQIPFKL